MKNIKLTFKFLCMLTICLIMLTMVVMAEEVTNEAKIEDIEYATLELAVENAQIGETITLLANVDLGTGIEYETGKNCGIIVKNGEELTINLNGNEIKSSANHSLIYVEAGAKLTIKDSSEEKTGKITSKGSYCIRNYGELVIDGGKYTVVDNTDTVVESYVLFARTNSTTTINAGEFNGYIGTNGYETITKLTINEGKFNKMLYLPGAGEYEINGGTFEVENNANNNAVIEVKRGTLTITGGTFKMNVATTVNNDDTVIGNNGSGDYVGVIIVSKTAGYEGGVTLIIEDGKFINTLGDAIVMANASVSDENASVIEVKGGEIEGNIVTYKEAKEVDKVEITGGTITEKITPVVEVKDGTEVRKYSSWEKAIEMEKADGIEIKLLANVDLGAGTEYETGKNCGIIVRAGEELTIDLNGSEIKSSANHSAIYVEAGAKLTIKDSSEGKTGKITSKGSYCIRNYGELVIDGGEYTVVDNIDTPVESYVLFARTNSTTTINNGEFNGYIGTNGYETITKLTINEGKFNKMLYLPGAGEYEINGGTFEVGYNDDNNAVVEVKRGTLTITGGTFKMNVDTSANNNGEVVVDGNGSGAYKAVIIASKKDGYEGNVNLIITDGTFINELGDAIIMANESTTLVSDIEITDGEITGDIAYYGLKNGEEGVITNNNITLKGNAATNYNITLHANKENKGVEDSTTVKTLTGKTYKVTLNSGEGKFTDDSSTKEIEVQNGTKYGDKLVNPTREGYTFNGWYIGETKITSDSVVDLTEDTIITAQYTKKSSNLGGGGGGAPIPKKEHKITITIGENGTISPDKDVTIEEGKSQTFTITANEGYEVEDVLVNGKSVGAVSTYTFENVKEDGKIEVKFKKIEVVEKIEYTDVKEDDWYKNAVDYVTEKGLMQGMGDNKFEPKTTTTRAMLVTILYNLEGNPEVDGEIAFPDVEADEWYTKAIIWAQKNNIVNGYDDGLFVPKGEVTREQMAVILANYLEYKGIKVEETEELTFEDNNKIADWSRQQVKIVKSLKIIQGREDNTYDPKNTATRAEIATVIMNFCENVKLAE